MDMDMVRSETRYRPFTPLAPPTPTVSTTKILAMCVFLLCGIYKISTWLVNGPATHAPSATEALPDHAKVGSEPALPSAPANGNGSTHGSVDVPRTRIVSKCLAGGKTGYSDGPCAPRSKAMLIATKPDQSMTTSINILPVPT